jgi:hypothetical protein
MVITYGIWGILEIRFVDSPGVIDKVYDQTDTKQFNMAPNASERNDLDCVTVCINRQVVTT